MHLNVERISNASEMQVSGGAADLPKHSVKAPSAGGRRGLRRRSLFESSVSCFCPLAHGVRFKFRGLSFHHKDELYSHEGEGGRSEK